MDNLEQRAATGGIETKSDACPACRGRHLSNIYDHRKPDARHYHSYSFYAYGNTEVERQEWQYHLDWINQNEVGRPKATAHYTVEQLESMGMIGVYAKEPPREN